MTSTVDCIEALRQAIKSKATITYSNGTEPTPSLSTATHLVLSPTTTLPKSSPTRFRKPETTSTDPSTSSQDFFSLEAVYLAWSLKDASGAEYMKQARENGLTVGFVSVTERKGLVDWLEGKTSSHESIVPLVVGVGHLGLSVLWRVVLDFKVVTRMMELKAMDAFTSLFIESTTPPGTPPRQAASLFPSTPSASKGVAQPDTPVGTAKRRYVADAQDVEVVKKIKQNEVELRDRTTILRGIKPNNFSAIRNVYTEKLKKLKEANKSGSAASAAAPKPVDPKIAARKARNHYPIIMISSSPTALITMHNVKRFLQESTFETSQEARARATAEGNPRPEDLIAIYRKRTHIDPSGKETTTHARYFVVDGVEALGKFGTDAWDRVVCVMTTGQAWQFRPYKWSEPRQLFHHVKGFYISWSNDPKNTKIQDWNVTELKIDPNRRHVDKQVVAHFWKTLDDWTTLNKPALMQ